MFYVYDHPVVAADIESSPHEETMQLGAGVIHQVDVLFQTGCNHLAHVQIFLGGYQLWPSNRGKTMRGNATVVSFREFLELKPGDSTLTGLIWGDGNDLAEIIIQIGMLPKRILQPLSFDELLSAASGM
ncbi:hypothetical protein ES703_73937 [subsurface metagenome]